MFCDLGQMVRSDWQLPSVKHVFIYCSGDFYNLATRFLNISKLISKYINSWIFIKSWKIDISFKHLCHVYFTFEYFELSSDQIPGVFLPIKPLNRSGFNGMSQGLECSAQKPGLVAQKPHNLQIGLMFFERKRQRSPKPSDCF